MPRKKKGRGRPMKRRYPPRVDATAEEVAKAMNESVCGPRVAIRA